MSLDPGLLDLCSTSVTVEAFTGFTSYGAPQYSTSSSTYTARFEYERRKTVDREGHEVLAAGTIFILSTSASITENDRITNSRSTNIRVLRVDALHDDEGLHHYEVAVA